MDTNMEEKGAPNYQVNHPITQESEAEMEEKLISAPKQVAGPVILKDGVDFSALYLLADVAFKTSSTPIVPPKLPLPPRKRGRRSALLRRAKNVRLNCEEGKCVVNTRKRFFKNAAVIPDLDPTFHKKRRIIRANDESEEEKRQRKSLSGQAAEEETGKGIKIKKKRPPTARRDQDHGPVPPPDMPVEIRNRIHRMGGSDAKLIIQKRLYDTDVNKNNNRFSIPFTKIMEEAKGFLMDVELQRLSCKEGNSVGSIDVKLIEPSSREDGELGAVSLRKWDMKKSSGNISHNYVLTGKWNAVTQRNHLAAGMVMQLWSFRVQKELLMALVRLS